MSKSYPLDTLDRPLTRAERRKATVLAGHVAIHGGGSIEALQLAAMLLRYETALQSVGYSTVSDAARDGEAG